MRVDLNADLGEGFGIWRLGDDDGLLDVVTSANVACGFHAGDPATMRRVCTRAVERGVRIGAQVGYRDLAGFGRRRIEMPPAELEAEVLYQIGALDGFARAAGDRVRYVKPHGALYNSAVDFPVQARAVAAASAAFGELALMGLPGSALQAAASEFGLPFITEAFADRAYTSAGRLVPRSAPNSVLSEPARVVARGVTMIREGTVTAVDGSLVSVRVDSLCVHGDTPGAVDLATRLREALTRSGITVGS